MAIEAQLADGRILEFPDGTDPAVVQATVKKVLGVDSPPPAQAQPQAPAPAMMLPEGIDPTPAPEPRKESVLEGMQMPAPLPTEDKMLNPEFVSAIQAQINALPEAKRQAALDRMAARPDVYGRAAKAIGGRYAAMDEAAKTQVPAQRRLDPRLEAQTERFIEQGMEAEAARNLARAQAQSGGFRPDLQQMTRDIEGEMAGQAAAEQRERLKDAGFFGRVGAETKAQYTQTGLGLMNVFADLTGDKQMQRRLASSRRMVEAEQGAIPKGDSIFERSAQGAISSLAGQAPMVLMSMATGTPAPVLLQAGVQQFGDSYGQARAAGQSPEAAAARAIPMAAAEVFFERFGMERAMAGLRKFVADAAKNGEKVTGNQIAEYVGKAVAKEIPSEMATTLTQYGIDVVPGVGLNKNPSLVELYGQLEETLRQTVIQAGVQSGALGLGAKGMEKVAKALTPERTPYKRDTSYEGRAQLEAMARGFLTPEGQRRLPPETRQIEQPVAPTQQPEAPEAPAADQRLEALTAQGIDAGLPEEDARVRAQNLLAAEDAKKTAALAPRIEELTQEYIDAGFTPDQARTQATAQAQEEVTADETAQREQAGVGRVEPPVAGTAGASAQMAGQPSTGAPAAGAGVTEPTGVVPAGQAPARVVGGEGAAPAAIGDLIGPIEGPARPNAPNEKISAEDSALLRKMVVKTIEDGLATGKTRKQIIDQIDALTKGGIKPSGFSRINDFLTSNKVKEEQPTTAAPTAVAGMKKAKDTYGNTVTEVKLSDGTTHQLIRLNHAESMGLPGWHDANKFGPNEGGFLGNNREEAVKELLRRRNEGQQFAPATPAPAPAPTPTEAPKAKRGRPAVLTEEEKQQRAEAKLPVQAQKMKADRAIVRLTKTLDELAQPFDDSEFDTDEEANAARDERTSQKRKAVQELLRMQSDPALRGTKVAERIKAALEHPSISAKEKADLKAGIEAQKRAQEGVSRSAISKGEADNAFSKFTNGAQALSHIIKTGNEFQKMLGKRLRAFVGNVKFVVIEEGQELPEQLKTRRNARSWERSIALYVENYKTGAKVIYVRGSSFGGDQGINNVTILHELLHAATNRKIMLAIDAIQRGTGLDSPLVRSAQALLRTMNSAAQTYNDMARQGKLPKELISLAREGEAITDPREFVAYGMTDEAFQNFLMQAHGYEEDTPYFTRFVDGIRRLFGMGEDSVNALSDLIVVTDSILRSRAPKVEITGEQASPMFGFGKQPEQAQAPQEQQPANGFVQARPSANVQRLAKMLGSKLYGTPKDIAAVSIKELFQNSFDAIKGALESNQLANGKIDIKLDRKDRSITITDNGLGMPTSVMGNQFLQIAGTVKETKRASGGLGVAKMLFLFENKNLEVVSLRDGVISRMVTNGEDLKAALDDPSRAPRIEINSDPAVVQRYVEGLFPDGHGTSVTIQVPESFDDPSTGEQETIPFDIWDLERAPVLLDSPLFDDIDVTLDSGYGKETLPIGKNFPTNDYTPFANVNFAWGTARIYISKDRKDRKYSRKNTHVLSNGLWQFNTDIMSGQGFDATPIQRDFYVDVSPAENVKPEDAGYPFDLNRQNFSKAASEDFSKIFNYITAIYSQLDLAQGVKNFGTVQYVNADGTVTEAEMLEPKAPVSENVFTAIKPDDEVEVRDGVLYVNNRALPSLTAEDLKKTSIKIDELTIPQDEIDPSKVMLHDNTEVSDMSAFGPGEVKKTLEALANNYPDRYAFFAAVGDNQYTMVAYDQNGEPSLDATGTPVELMDWALSNGMFSETPVDMPKGEPMSLTDVARDEFGADRVNKYLAEIGDTFQLLRNALVAGGRGEYADLRNEAIGVSVDVEYYGVSIRVPFHGMFINPATTDMHGTPAEIAISMIGTMIHELAHFKVRNHGASFASEMQRVMTLLKVFPGIDLPQVEKNLTKHIADNQDIFDFMNKEFRSGNLKPRGNRFKDGSYQQIGLEGPAEPVEGAGGAGAGGQRVSQSTGAGTPSSGQVSVGAGGASQAAQAGTKAVKTQKQIEREFQIANEKFDQSLNGEEYSKSITAIQLLQNPKQVGKVLANIWSNFSLNAKNALTRIAPTDFLADAFSDAVPELRNTDTLMQKMQGMTLNLLKSAGKLTAEVDRAYRKDPALREKLDRITHVSTLMEVDPSDPNAKERSARLDKLWNELGDDGQRMYKRIKDHFEVLSDYFTQLLDEQITQSGLPIAERSNLLAKVRAMYETGTKITPFFPLVRRGDFWLSIGTGKTRKFFMFETLAERDDAMQGFADERVKQKPGESDKAFEKRRAQNLQDLLESEEYTYGNDISTLRRVSGDSSEMLKGVFQAIDSAKLGEQDAKDELKDAVYQIYLQTMPEQSFRRQFIHRKGVTGFRTDVLRNTADATSRMAVQLARIKYGRLLRNSLSQVRDSIVNRPEYEPVVAAFERRVRDELNPRPQAAAEKVAGGLNKAAFIWYLGGASSALLQPLSVFQTGMPVLNKYGFANAAAEMGRMLKVWDQLGVYEKNADGTTSYMMPTVEHAKGLTEEERRAVRAMLDYNLTTSTYAHNVFDYKNTPSGNYSAPVVQFGKDTVDALVLGGLMHTTERVSREMMFLASFRLNRKAGKSFDAAVDQAVVDTKEALGNYGEYNRPEFMRGAVGKVLTQFMMYPVHVSLFLVRNFAEMIKPMGGRTRQEARRKFFGTLGTTFILAGAVGLPMFSTVMGLLGWAWEQFKEDDDPEDLKSMSFELWFRTVWLQEMLGQTKIAGKNLADVVERGVANAITGLDISSRTSLNNLWMRDTKEYATVRDTAGAMALEKAGPAANMVLSWAEAYEAFMLGDYKKGVKKAMPAGFRNYVNAYEQWKEGSKDNKGAKILSKDAFTTGELIGQAVGFRSDLLANTQYVTFKVIGLEQKINNERTKILNQLDRELRNRNMKKFAEYLKDLNEFNRKYPSYAVDDDALSASLERKGQQRAESYRGVTLTDKNVGVFGRALIPSRKAAAEKEKKGRE